MLPSQYEVDEKIDIWPVKQSKNFRYWSKCTWTTANQNPLLIRLKDKRVVEDICKLHA